MTRPERLLAELHSYAAADPAEAQHRDRMVALLSRRGRRRWLAKPWARFTSRIASLVERNDISDVIRNSAADPFGRGHFTPGHFTASCYIVDGEGRILLHHHRRLDRWLQMGGHLEEGETPAEAALREGAEESGLPDLELAAESLFDLDIHSIPAGRGEPDHFHYDLRYVATTKTPSSIAIDRTESKELAWMSLDRAAALMPGPESQRVLQKIRQLFRERSLH